MSDLLVSYNVHYFIYRHYNGTFRKPALDINPVVFITVYGAILLLFYLTHLRSCYNCRDQTPTKEVKGKLHVSITNLING